MGQFVRSCGESMVCERVRPPSERESLCPPFNGNLRSARLIRHAWLPTEFRLPRLVSPSVAHEQAVCLISDYPQLLTRRLWLSL